MIRKIILLLCLALVAETQTAMQNVDTSSKMKSLFIYSFTKYVDWPADYKSGDFVIGILGDSPLAKELEKMAATKKVATQKIVLKKFASASAIEKCHMLVVPKAKASSLGSAAAKVKANSTLVVGDASGALTSGAGINFTIQASRTKFELHKKNVESHNLTVSSNLVKLAVNCVGC